MNRFHRLELWAGRLPIGRAIEALAVAAILAALALLTFAPESHAQSLNLTDSSQPAPAASSDTVRLVEALERILAQREQTLQIALSKLPTGGVVMVPQQAPIAAPQPAQEGGSPIVNACAESWVKCGLQLLASAGSGTVEAIKALVPLAQPIAAIHTTRAQAAANVKVAEYGRDQNVALYGTFAQMSAHDSAAWAAASANGNAILASLAANPTTSVTVNGNGPVNTGTGTITNASHNPVTTTTQPPVVVVGTPTTTVSRGP